MLMFIVCLFGFAVMGYSVFGQNSRKFSDLFFTIIEFFKLMIEYFDYDGMYAANPTFAAPFFISFMLLFDQFMKNMFIAIIMAHYNEFQEFSGKDFQEERDAQLEDSEMQNQTKVVGSGFNQITDMDGDNNKQNQDQLKRLLFGVFKSFLFHPKFKKVARRSKKGLIKWYVSKWDQLEGFIFKEREEDNDDEILEQHIKELEHVLENKYAKPEYDKDNLHNFVRPFFQPEIQIDSVSGSNEVSLGIGLNNVKVEQNLEFNLLGGNNHSRKVSNNINGSSHNSSQLPDSNDQAPDNRFQLDPEEQKIQEAKMKKEIKKEYELKYGSDNPDNQALMLNYINVIPKNFEGLSENELANSNVWIAALEKILFNQSQKTIVYSDLYEPEDLLWKQDHDGTQTISDQTPIYDTDQFSTFQAEYLMKDFEERSHTWKKSKISQKFQLWQVMDFEKMFEDENKYRDKYAERLETFLDLINQMQKDLDEWEKKQLDQQNNNNYHRDKIKNLRNSRQARIDKIQQLIVNKKQDLIKQVPVLTFKKINRSPELSDPDYSRASSIQKYLWINNTSQDEKFLLWFKYFSPFYRTKLWNALSFSEDYLISIVNTTKFFRQDLALKFTMVLNEIKYKFLAHLKEQLKELEEQNKDLDGTLHKKAYINYKKQLSNQQLLINKIQNNQKKLEDIAKIATYEIRSTHLNPDFFIECLEIMSKKKCKVFQKIRQDANTKKLFDMIFQEHERMKFEEATQKLKLFTKRRPVSENMIATQPTIVKNPSLNMKGSSKQLNELKLSTKEELMSPKLKKQQNGSMSPQKRDSNNMLNSLALKFQSSTNNKLLSPNKSIEQIYDQNQFGSIVHLGPGHSNNFASMHQRGISGMPLIKSQTASPTVKQDMNNQYTNRDLLVTSEKLRALTEVNKDFTSKENTERENALKLKYLNQKQSAIENNENFEIKKISSKVYIETLKHYFSIMVHGMDGKRLHYLHSHFQTDPSIQQSHLDQLKTLRQKYLYLVQTMDPHEERLALWLTMSEDDKLRMLSCQHIESEAETMSRLLIEEIESQPSSYYRMQEIDRKLERTLDNQIYEKYRRLTEWQALKTTSLCADKRLKRLDDEDFGLLNLIQYLTEKSKDLDQRKRFIQKDVVKKYKENQLWRQQYENKKLKQD